MHRIVSPFFLPLLTLLLPFEQPRCPRCLQAGAEWSGNGKEMKKTRGRRKRHPTTPISVHARVQRGEREKRGGGRGKEEEDSYAEGEGGGRGGRRRRRIRRREEIDPLPLCSPMHAANTQHATGFLSPRCDAKRSFTRRPQIVRFASRGSLFGESPSCWTNRLTKIN